MSIRLSITTYNESAKYYGAGYHELHDISYLSSPEHAIETIKSIINLNLKYSVNTDCTLKNVYIECGDSSVEELFHNTFDHNSFSDGVTIVFVFNPALN